MNKGGNLARITTSQLFTMFIKLSWLDGLSNTCNSNIQKNLQSLNSVGCCFTIQAHYCNYHHQNGHLNQTQHENNHANVPIDFAMPTNGFIKLEFIIGFVFIARAIVDGTINMPIIVGPSTHPPIVFSISTTHGTHWNLPTTMMHNNGSFNL